MERSTAKKLSRRKLIRKRTEEIKKKSRCKKPAKEIIKRLGRYKAIEAAKKQLSETQQSVVQDAERQTYTAVDEVECYSTNAAIEVLQISPHGKGNPSASIRGNSFHGETDYQKEMKRQSLVRRGKKKVRASTSTCRVEKSASSFQTTGQRQKTWPRDSSSVGVSKAQIVKEQGRRLARDQVIQESKTATSKSVSGKVAKASNEFFKKLGSAITRTVTPSRDSLLYAAGILVLIVVPFVIVMGVASMLTGRGDGRSAYKAVSAEVDAYRPLIRMYAMRYGIPEYEDLIAAVMMQESRGRGSDPMQASECSHNTRYPHEPNSITDPEYSIDVGVHMLADVLTMSDVESPIDLDRISLALQGYNFGPGYISWALTTYGGYSELNAIEFSDMMAERLGWAGYGDKSYVSHVLRYYPIGRFLMGEGNTAIVAVAQLQIGNVGGEPYWSWWGYHERVEWCAIFVSWCADQCGYLDAGVLPKMEGVHPYIDWFVQRDQWQGHDYEPLPGDIIFIDWESDGMADHVGIVERVEDDLVYTIEGNNGDRCAECRYTLASAPIFGYGLTDY